MTILCNICKEYIKAVRNKLRKVTQEKDVNTKQK